MQIKYKRITETGIIADIKGNGEKTVAIRADMDALPVTEENQTVFYHLNGTARWQFLSRLEDQSYVSL